MKPDNWLNFLLFGCNIEGDTGFWRLQHFWWQNCWWAYTFFLKFPVLNPNHKGCSWANSLSAKILIEPVIIFDKIPGAKFSSPIFCNALNAGLPSFAFPRWQMQYTEREHPEQVLKTRFYFNYFTLYSGTDTQGSQELIPNLSFRRFNMVQKWNDCMCIT